MTHYEKDTELLQYLVTGTKNSFKPYDDTPAQELRRIFTFGQNIHLYQDDFGFEVNQFAEYMNTFCYKYCSEIIKMYGHLDYCIELFREQIFLLFPGETNNCCEQIYHLTQLSYIYSNESCDQFYVIDKILVNLVDNIVGDYKTLFKKIE